MIRQFIAYALLAGAAAPALADEPPADLQRKLAEAQTKLDAAAREVAELSMQVGGPSVRSYVFRGDGGPRRAILGVQLGEGGGEDAKNGAKVVTVSPGGPAASAGLKSGDLIVEIDDVDLRARGNAERELVQKMRTVAPDQKVKLKVQRDGKIRDFVVTARAAPAPMMVGDHRSMAPGARMGPPGAMMAGPGALEGFDVENLPGVIGAMVGARSFPGLELATLTPKLGQYFGVDKGVLVLKAPEANKLKLEEGDVIVAIDGRSPATSSHALRILRSYQPGEKVKLRVQRQRKESILDGEIEQAPRDDKRLHGQSGSMPEMLLDRMQALPPEADAPRVEKRIVIRPGDEERT